MKLKTLLITALCLLGLITPAAARAASFSVRLGVPKSPTNQNNIKLTYVALDSDNKVITVKCFKKGPSDSGFSEFDTPRILIPGGNTDHCTVDSNIISTKGTYSFYITGQVGGEVVTSSTVSLDFSTDGPGSPSDYSKEKINNCDYRIKFKTADDGNKTIKVQLFRSDNLSVSVDNNNVVATQNIGSNTNGEIINRVPDCNKNYYYELRAVDNSDNVSGVVGDSFTTTITSSLTASQSTNNGSTAIPLTQGSQVNTQPTPSLENTEVTVTPETSPSVLGTSTNKFNILKWIIPIVLVIVGYFLITRKKKSN